MTEAEILEFNGELENLLDRFCPDDNPERERIIATMMLCLTVAMASAGELSREEFLQDCASRWDDHWKMFNAHQNQKTS